MLFGSGGFRKPSQMSRRSAAAYSVWVTATALGFGVLSALAIHSALVHNEWRFDYVPKLGDYTTTAVTILPLLAGQLAFRRARPLLASLLAVTIALTRSWTTATPRRAAGVRASAAARNERAPGVVAESLIRSV